MSVSASSVFLGCTLLLVAVPAVAADEVATAPVSAPEANATVKCPGITSIPVTVDAAQTLPLRLLGTISCNESVTILADTQGYTVHVRTSDGKDGYVARMYLKMGGSPVTVAGDQPTSASAVNNVVRWQARAPGCDQFFSKGHTVESATANGVTVQVSLEDSGWKLRATVAVSNKGEEIVEVLPGLITLDELQPNLKALLAQDPAKLSHVVNHQVLLSLAYAQPSRSATRFTEVSPQAITAAHHPPAQDYFSDQVGLFSPATHSASVPSPETLQSMALKHVKLTSGQKTSGVMWFERDSNAHELSLRVPVGDLVFDFPLSFEQKN